MSDLKKAFDWFDQQAKEGKELSINWEGGSDSGWCYFSVDGETCENEHTELVVDMMYDKLDYGSWAGEFYASGEAVYDSKTKQFEGVDSCGIDETCTFKCTPVIIKIPKKFPFDVVSIETEGVECFVTVSLEGATRFEHPEEAEYLQSLEEPLNEDITDRILEKTDDPSYYANYRIAKTEMMEDGEFLVGKLEELDAQISQNEDRTMIINLKELLENE